ncbi:MAG TPA: sensor histidine kinase KdpD, partial [Caulifigura sp.]|nr:sensor histidine kinase KdpD [Caulifigura sp.]
QRGKLKIFFGMAPGVGKTYAMLEAAHKVGKEGKDVIVGYIEPHARPETQALVLGLDILARRTVTYRDRTLFEFDLEAALARKPELILIDELAHTNIEGSTHPKRWQDVEDLLAAGIDVYTTLNVQHIESLNDVVAQITSIPVKETVPDQVFERADEIELVDLAPDDLIDRMREGRVYLPDQALRALENFFKEGNLIALRELALRKTAERVSNQALTYRKEHAVEEVWPTSDRLLVCVGSSPMSSKLVRATRRMASSLRAPWIALHVDLDAAPIPSADDARRLEQHLRLAEQLGAKVVTATGSEFAETVLAFAREHNVTKIIVGKPQHSRWREWTRGAIVYDLIRQCGDVDVYVISGDEEKPEPHKVIAPSRGSSRTGYLWAALAIAVVTALGFVVAPYLDPTNLVMLYMAAVVATSLLQGRGPSVFATVLGVAAFDVCFVPPRGTLAVTDTQYLVTFGVMLTTGLVISELAARVRAQTVAARQRERNTAALYALTRELTNLATPEAVVQASRRIVAEAMHADVWILLRDPATGRIETPSPSPSSPPAKDVGVIQWVFDHRRPAGRGTDTLAGSEACYLPILVTNGILGVIGLRSEDPASWPALRQDSQLFAYIGQIASAIERCELAREAEQTRLQIASERLRNSLLSSVSHDLRTPLSTITGAANLLLHDELSLDNRSRHELVESIYDESDRMTRLVANLLDLTRLEAGAIEPHLELQPIEEVIGVVLERLHRQLKNHAVSTSIPADLPPVAIDGLLMQQVFVNLLENATRFAPAGTPIEIAAFVDHDALVIEIADRGPGIPPGQERRIFQKFYRLNDRSGSGTGIGLAICRGVVELHRGQVLAKNRPDGGAIFRVELPLTRQQLAGPSRGPSQATAATQQETATPSSRNTNPG